MLYDYGVIGGSLLLLLVLGFHFTDKERWFNIVAVILGAYVWQRWFNEVKLVELWSRVSTETVYGFAVIGGGMALFILAERLYPDQKLVYVPGWWKRVLYINCLLYTSPSPRDGLLSRMPSSA